MAVYVCWLFAVLLIPVVTAFNELLAHHRSHESGSVRFLKTNETVYETGSDLIFNWERCVVCDGYDVRLYLQDSFRKQEAHYQLKSAVTALKVPDVRPRTNYKLLIRALPTDPSASEISGRSFFSEAPPPVRNLAARTITNTSIRIEWDSENADGFVVRVFENDTVVHERVIPEFSRHSIVKVTDLNPETSYRVEVIGFYFPPTGKSKSAVSSVWVKTLPVVLPRIRLNWELNPKLKLFWKNPEFPFPVAHSVVCIKYSSTAFVAEFSGSTDFVVLSNEIDTTETRCSLETSYSDDSSSKVTSTVRVRRMSSPSPERPSVSSRFSCRDYDWYKHADVRGSMEYKKEEHDGSELLVLEWKQKSSSNDVKFIGASYRICKEDGTCPDWIHWGEPSRILVNPVSVKPWVPHLVQFYFRYRCNTTRDKTSSQNTEAGSLEVPPLFGTVDPVREVTATAEQVSWKYDSSSGQPDHFLVTYCVGDHCTSQSAPGRNRSLKLGGLRERRVYFVTIQAVQRLNDRIYVSPIKMTSFIAPKKTSETVALSANEVANSSTVRLLIAHNVTSDAPAIVEYHIAVCGEPVTLWNDSALVKLSNSNTSCESMISTVPSLDLQRKPWTVYKVSVVLCYGTYDFNDPVNLTLPVFKEYPAAVDGLTWEQESTTLSWTYESSIPSGFSISMCPSTSDVSRNCSVASVGPLERHYHVDAKDRSDAGSVASVTPFVTYQGTDYYGSKSELEIIFGSTSPATMSSTTVAVLPQTMSSKSRDEFLHEEEE